MKPHKRISGTERQSLFLLFISLALVIFIHGQDPAEKKLELVVQTGHTYPVQAAQMTPDGKMLVSLGMGRLKFWEIETGRELRTLSVDSGSITSFSFTPDGKRLVTGITKQTAENIGTFSGELKFWDAKSLKEIRSLDTGEGIPQIKFSPDGKLLGITITKTFLHSQMFEINLRVLESETGNEISEFTFDVRETGATSYEFEKDGRKIITLHQKSFGFSPRTAKKPTEAIVKTWDLKTRKELSSLKFTGKVGSIFIINRPGGNLVSAGEKEITFWDLKSGNKLKTFSAQFRFPNGFVFSPDGKTLAFANGFAGLSSIVDSENGKVRGVESFPVCFSPDGKTLVTVFFFKLGEARSEIQFLDVKTGKKIKTLESHAYGIPVFEFNENGTGLAVSGLEDVRIWNLATGKTTGISTKHGNPFLRNFKFIKDELILLNAEPNSFKVNWWDVKSRKELKTMTFEAEGSGFVHLSSDGGLLTALKTEFRDKTFSIRIWDLLSGAEINTFTVNDQDLISFDVSRDKTTLTAVMTEKIPPPKIDENDPSSEASAEMLAEAAKGLKTPKTITVKKWDLPTGKESGSFSFLSTFPTTAFSNDGRMLAVGSRGDNRITLFDVETGKELRTTPLETVPGLLKFSPDGKILASTTANGKITIWDVATGNKIKTLISDSGGITSLNFSPDGQILAVAPAFLGRVDLYDVAKGVLLCSLVTLDERDWAVIAPDGRFDASEGALELMHYVYGLEVINLEQLKEAYFEPGLLPKLLGYSQEPLRSILPLEDVRLYPEIIAQEFDEDSKKLTIKLKARTGGIGETRVLVNNKLAVPDVRTEELKKNPDVSSGKTVTLTADLKGASFIRGAENEIKVITSNHLKEIGRGNIRSRGYVQLIRDKREKEFRLPSLYAIVGGISDYDGDKIDLKFAAKDAEDFSNALSLGAKRLFCDKLKPDCLDKVQIKKLSTSDKKGAIPPTKENFKKAFAEIAEKAKPEDILVIYLAGHGVTLGDDSYFYLTREARSLEDLEKNFQNVAISSRELTDWLTQTEWVTGEKGLKPVKLVMILDTCAAGKAASQLALTAKRELSSDQIRAIEFLKDKTGTFILMGSSSDQASYEASRFGQGLLTYSLLQAMKGAELDRGEYVDVRKLFSYAERTVPDMARNIGGVQKPIISAPLGTTFPIGRMTDEDKKLIDLPVPKPLMLRPTLGVSPFNNDPLSLVSALRKRLDAESSYEVVRRRGGEEPILIYIDDDSFPGAVRITGTYTVEGEKVTVKAYLGRDNKVIAELPEIIAGKDEVVEKLMEVIRNSLNEQKVTGTQ